MALEASERQEMEDLMSVCTYGTLMRAARKGREEAPEKPTYVIVTKAGQTVCNDLEFAKAGAQLFVDQLGLGAVVVGIVAVRGP